MDTASLPFCPVPSMNQGNICKEDWVWDHFAKSPDVTLSANHRAAYFHIDPIQESVGTAGVRGTEGFSDGEHYWEVTFLEPPFGTSVMVGVGTDKATLHTDNYRYVNLLGLDEQSWGLSYKGKVYHNGSYHKYCDAFFAEKTVIGVHLDLYQGRLSFYKNGQCLGTAFEGLHKVPDKLYPMISSTTALTELEVGMRMSRQSSLEEKCYLTVVRNLKRKADTGCLPLPAAMKKQIVQLN